MPKYPGIDGCAAAITEVLFSDLALRLRNHQGETYPLHVGETWLPPPPELNLNRLTLSSHPELYQYSPSYGREGLLELLAERLSTNEYIHPDRLFVAAGAMGAITSICATLISPGDEVLVLAPHWPLIPGIVRIARGTPVPVPFWGRANTEADVHSVLEEGLSERSTCIYLNTPNNPAGRVMPASWIRAIVDFARAHNLWILSDEVYADYAYRTPHENVFPRAPERTFSIYSFSKSCAAPGLRCGYAVGPQSEIRIARRISTHISYGAPTPSQIAAENLLRSGVDTWIAAARLQYAAIGASAAMMLDVPRPEGGHFLFIDGGPVLRRTGMHAFLETAVARGLLVAPGTMCGPYPDHLRLCFTAVPPEAMIRGVAILAELLR